MKESFKNLMFFQITQLMIKMIRYILRKKAKIEQKFEVRFKNVFIYLIYLWVSIQNLIEKQY